jgi:predicted permease
VKFKQFHYADLGLGNRVFAATIGFLATSLVGIVAAWFLARRLIPEQPRSDAVAQIAWGFGIIFACALLVGLIGFAYGLWRGPNAKYGAWEWAFHRYDIKDRWSFVRVAYIHNSSYLGGALGLILALAFLRPKRASSAADTPSST